MPMVGGLGAVKPADDAVKCICAKMKKKVEEKTGRSFSTFDAVEYKIQTVAGKNYFIKIHAGSEQYIHICVYEPLPSADQEMSLTDVQLDKTKEDEIKHF
ncbi:cystatin-A1-like [Mixophyes fleayi]|uniref:cystatin-A1-like n=1 Tax=Mixophyes fleayi TaxID=3061075 RepID=UPI003F4E1FCB